MVGRLRAESESEAVMELTTPLMLTKPCQECQEFLALISREPWAINQPIRRWECPNKHWQPLYGREEEK